MPLRSLALSFLVIASLSCRDDPTRPDVRAGPPPPPTIAELAARLRGDPFLGTLAREVGDSSIAAQLDRALRAIADQVDVAVSERAVASSRLMLLQLAPAAPTDPQSAAVVTEHDILNGVLELAVDGVDALLQSGAPSAAVPAVPPFTDR